MVKGKYNSLDNDCLFSIYRRLNRQFVQWVVYFAVCKKFNLYFGT
jgi:hypothetical protein